MWIGSGGCSNCASTIFSRPALSEVGRLIEQHAGQTAVLLGILDRGIGAVGGKPRRAGDADLAAVFDETPVRRRGHGAELDRVMRGDLLRPFRLAARFQR